MNTSAPSRIGKIGYLIAYIGVYLFFILPIVDLTDGVATVWDIAFIVSGGLAIFIGCFITRRDAYMKQLQWKLALWKGERKRDRFANYLIGLGSGYAIVIIGKARDVQFKPDMFHWILTCITVAFLIIGWCMVLTGREEVESMQQGESSVKSA